MPFKPGESGNPAGRKRGSRNKLNATSKRKLAAFFESQIDNLPMWFEQISDPRDKVSLLIKIAPYVVAKVKPEGNDDQDREDRPVSKLRLSDGQVIEFR